MESQCLAHRMPPSIGTGIHGEHLIAQGWQPRSGSAAPLLNPGLAIQLTALKLRMRSIEPLKADLLVVLSLRQ